MSGAELALLASESPDHHFTASQPSQSRVMAALLMLIVRHTPLDPCQGSSYRVYWSTGHEKGYMVVRRPIYNAYVCLPEHVKSKVS